MEDIINDETIDMSDYKVLFEEDYKHILPK